MSDELKDIETTLAQADTKLASTESSLSNTADTAVAQINKINSKLEQAKVARETDPETAGEKVFKVAAPALAGMVAGKVFSLAWNAVTSKLHPSLDDDEKDAQQGFFMSVLFSALSAAFTSIITQGATKGSNLMVKRAEKKRAAK